MTSPGVNGDSPGMTGGSTADKQVSDDENKSQNATIRRIQSFRDEIAEYQLLFAQSELSDEISAAQLHRAYHQLAKGFLKLLRPYLTDESIPAANNYWDEKHLGTITVPPPEVIRKPSQQEMQTAVRGGHQQMLARAGPRNTVEPREFEVRGLRDFAASPPEWQVEWTVMFGPDVSTQDLRSEITDSNVRVETRSHRNEPITVLKTARIPRRVLDDIVTALEQFVREIGMDIEMEAEPYEGEEGPGL